MMTRPNTSITALVTLACALSACDDAYVDTVIIDQETTPCEQAAAQLEACTGTADVDFEANCTTADAAMLLETPCEVLQAATDSTTALKADGWDNDSSFACGMLNLGCPPQDSCQPMVSDFALAELIMLSEPSA